MNLVRRPFLQSGASSSIKNVIQLSLSFSSDGGLAIKGRYVSNELPLLDTIVIHCCAKF